MTRIGADVRWDVPTADALRRLAREPLPIRRLHASEAVRIFMRDVYYDTRDLTLRERGVTCRVRYRADDRHELLVSLVRDRDGDPDVTRAETELPGGNVQAALDGHSEPARLIRAIVNPSALGPQLELEIERHARSASSRWPLGARFELEYDIVTVRAGGLSRTFNEIALRVQRPGTPSADQVARAMSEEHALRALVIDRRDRAEQLRAALESEALARGVGEGRWIALAAFDGAFIATTLEGTLRRLLVAEGSGEDACRHLLRRTLGSSVGELHLLGTTVGEERLRALEVWTCTRVDRSAQRTAGTNVVWMPIEQLLARIGSPEIVDTATLAALAVLSRSEMLPRLVSLPSAAAIEERTDERKAVGGRASSNSSHESDPLLDAEASLLMFNSRVLALAEDPATPLLERVRYIAIVASNLDEFFSVRVGGLKFDAGEVEDESAGTLTAEARLAFIRREARSLIVRQNACVKECLQQLALNGFRLRGYGELNELQREHLRGWFRSTVFPYLTPRAITFTPGHSLPVVADHTLLFAVALREPGMQRLLHLAELTVPTDLPRFVQLPESTDYVAIEEVIRAHVALLYPGRRVEQAHLFRVTRCSDVGLDEQRTGNLVQAMEERTQQRRHQPIVRLEIESAMPASMRELLLRELQLEPGARPGSLDGSDIFETPGLMGLEALHALANLPSPALAFPSFQPRHPLPADASLWSMIRERDLLFHHPYDDYATTVVRFFEDAAGDADVVAIKVALYRAGERSPIVDALVRAANSGKHVSVFVELKARFDEERNVRWTRRLQSAGAHVVHGLPGYKNHSKIALVVRREADGPRRYAHIGTGNYNAATARVYTDLGVLTSREGVCDDVSDLFNTLTGSSAPSDVAFRDCLVAPNAMLRPLIERIEREAEHARSGPGGRIRIKINGLSDKEVVSALYRAAQAGVAIDLVVRGVCTLAPGVPGVSDRIRVISLLGRFLEHARIYSFDNAGAPEYFIGSADLRPRNLRRRIEVLVPIVSASERARLDEILERELHDPTAWRLTSEGSYVREPVRDTGGDVSAQSYFTARAQTAASPGTETTPA